MSAELLHAEASLQKANPESVMKSEISLLTKVNALSEPNKGNAKEKLHILKLPANGQLDLVHARPMQEQSLHIYFFKIDESTHIPHV